ncbi:MAG: hypothetical protein R3C05_13820 [Pirellulaceae bacterium]
MLRTFAFGVTMLIGIGIGLPLCQRLTDQQTSSLPIEAQPVHLVSQPDVGTKTDSPDELPFSSLLLSTAESSLDKLIDSANETMQRDSTTTPRSIPYASIHDAFYAPGDVFASRTSPSQNGSQHRSTAGTPARIQSNPFRAIAESCYITKCIWRPRPFLVS